MGSFDNIQSINDIPSFSEYQQELTRRRVIAAVLTLVLVALVVAIVGGIGVAAWQTIEQQRQPKPTPQPRTWCMQGGLYVLSPGDVCRGYIIVANW